jgi:hypothetical protein
MQTSKTENEKMGNSCILRKIAKRILVPKRLNISLGLLSNVERKGE